MHAYRTHNCGEPNETLIGQTVRLSGWINRKRDHGGLLFIDLRDHYGLMQCVIDQSNALFTQLDGLRLESVVTLTGEVVARPAETVNKGLPTGAVELKIAELSVISEADPLPLQVNSDAPTSEELRLQYRYLDLRRAPMQSRIKLRTDVISHLRKRMNESGFREFQTPILTASSPEGARDYLVPSRLHPGKFYALPQAPQQFKQLLMVGGFDRYFQIAPCFRDEDGRADRLAEFYQLDVEMSFVTQDDVFATMEPVIGGMFEEFSSYQGKKLGVTQGAWPRIPYDEAMLKYGSDKPDLRNPLEIFDVTAVFAREDVEFKAFKGIIAQGGVVRAIRAPGATAQPRSFFDKLNGWAQGEGAPGLGYVSFDSEDGQTVGKGPIAKFLPAAAQAQLREIAGAGAGEAVFFVADKKSAAEKLAGKARNRIADELGLIDRSQFRLCWIVDFPMYELDEKSGKIDFSHNPFSMVQGGLEALTTQDPLTLKASQYDAVCNGFELASGAIRNHRPEVMAKAFEIAGYDRAVLEAKFGGMLNAFRFGPPVHGGCAFGIDRMIMLLADEPNLREVYPFVMNGAYEDPMMGAPTLPTPQQLKDLHLKPVALPQAADKGAA